MEGLNISETTLYLDGDFTEDSDEAIDLQGDNAAAIAAAEYLAGAEAEREGKKRKDAAAARGVPSHFHPCVILIDSHRHQPTISLPW